MSVPVRVKPVASLLHVLRGSACALACLSSAPLFAQGAPDAPVAADEPLQEVVVTARGREEDLQEVPIAITVLSTDDLQARTIVDVRDVVAFTPSMTFYSGSGRADLSALVVRGLSPQTSDERYQGLSIFVDGIYISGQLAGRAVAAEHGLMVAGTAAVIGMAKSRGLIVSARAVFSRLHASDFRISAQVIETVLERAGE